MASLQELYEELERERLHEEFLNAVTGGPSSSSSSAAAAGAAPAPAPAPANRKKKKDGEERQPMSDADRRRALVIVRDEHFGGDPRRFKPAFESARSKRSAGDADIAQAEALMNAWNAKFMESDGFGDEEDELFKESSKKLKEGNQKKREAAAEARSAQAKGAYVEPFWAALMQHIDRTNDPVRWKPIVYPDEPHPL